MGKTTQIILITEGLPCANHSGMCEATQTIAWSSWGREIDGRERTKPLYPLHPIAQVNSEVSKLCN